MDNLNNCPFCGSEAYIETWESRKGKEGSASCVNCPATMVSITFDTEEQVIAYLTKHWNQRTQSPAQPRKE